MFDDTISSKKKNIYIYLLLVFDVVHRMKQKEKKRRRKKGWNEESMKGGEGKILKFAPARKIVAFRTDRACHSLTLPRLGYRATIRNAIHHGLVATNARYLWSKMSEDLFRQASIVRIVDTTLGAILCYPNRSNSIFCQLATRYYAKYRY